MSSCAIKVPGGMIPSMNRSVARSYRSLNHGGIKEHCGHDVPCVMPKQFVCNVGHDIILVDLDHKK